MRNAGPGLGAAELGGALHLQGKNTELDVRLDAARRPVKDRPQFEASLLQPAEAGFDDPGALVAECDVLGRERVVIGDDNELAVELCGRLDLGRIEAGAAEVIGGKIAAVAARGQERTGRLGMIGLTGGEPIEFAGE